MILSNPVYETSITLLPKPDKGFARKLQATIAYYIKAETINKMLAN